MGKRNAKVTVMDKDLFQKMKTELETAKEYEKYTALERRLREMIRQRLRKRLSLSDDEIVCAVKLLDKQRAALMKMLKS